MAAGVSRRSVVLVAAFLALVLAAGCAGKKSSGGGGDDNIGAIQLATLINDYRESQGAARLNWDATIASVEQAHAAWLAEQPPTAYMYPYYEEGEDDKLFPERLTDAGFTDFSEAKEYGFASVTLTNAGLVYDQLPADVFDPKWDKFGIGYVRPPYRESGQHYWIIGLTNN
jgi:hypothetical protein